MILWNSELDLRNLPRWTILSKQLINVLSISYQMIKIIILLKLFQKLKKKTKKMFIILFYIYVKVHRILNLGYTTMGLIKNLQQKNWNPLIVLLAEMNFKLWDNVLKFYMDGLLEEEQFSFLRKLVWEWENINPIHLLRNGFFWKGIGIILNWRKTLIKVDY